MARSRGGIRSVTVLTAAALSSLLWACSPTLNWRENIAEGSGLVTMFPCRPDRHARAVEVAGAQVSMQMLVCSAGDATYAVSFFDASDAAAVGPALSMLQATMIANIGSAAPVLGRFRLAGATQTTRISAAGRRPDGHPLRLEAAFFAKDRRLYQAAVVGPALSEEAVDPFFTGMRLPD